MKLLLRFETRVGTFFIGQSRDGCFHPVYNDEDFGSYKTIGQAAEAIATNSTFSVLHQSTRGVLDTSTLGIPEDPRDWRPANCDSGPVN